ncbi:MAG TPA: hypothetical protein VE553_05165 [Candidatus Binatia bacterium]|nr:hypothetical protein [Candidatus Binatia bacterium]
MAIPTVRQNRSIASKRALLQSGGEGAVYVQRGKAVKIYHRPTTQRSEKLRAFVAQRLLQQLPAGVLGPERLVVDGNGTVNGFEMALLPATAQP